MGNRTDLIASFEVDSLFPTDITFTLSPFAKPLTEARNRRYTPVFDSFGEQKVSWNHYLSGSKALSFFERMRVTFLLFCL